MEIFEMVDYQPQLKPEFQLLPCVRALQTIKYNRKWPGDSDGRKRLRAEKELIYLYYRLSPASEFSEYPDDERDVASLEAAGLDISHLPSGELLETMGVFKRFFEDGSRILRILKGARGVVDKLDNYFNNISFEIEEGDNLDVQKLKTELASKAMDNISKLPKLVKDLDVLEERYKREHNAGERTKGDAEPGRLR